uniref:Uncharacterized protein n=1 Tax=blood disease bacterium R229 TaxID=741978 RepID=G2ZMA1_9RALS|nr:conserved hypothetical protein [blood disease bacterium R229]
MRRRRRYGDSAILVRLSDATSALESVRLSFLPRRRDVLRAAVFQVRGGALVSVGVCGLAWPQPHAPGQHNCLPCRWRRRH